MMDITFRQFLELSTVGSGASLANKQAIAGIGAKVQDALRQGKDAVAAAQDAGTDAAKTISTNAASSGGEGASDLGTAVAAIDSVAKAAAKNKPGVMQKMKKK